MVRSLALLLALCAATAYSQSGTTPTIKSNATLILVPTEVRTRAGELIHGLDASQFKLEDNGVPQKPHLDDPDTPQPMRLVVVVQCSRQAYREAAQIKGLATMIEDLVGAAPHTVAVVSFGNEPDLVQDFTSDPFQIRNTFSQIQPCREQDQNVTLDAVRIASQLLHGESPASARKVILLVSETRDHGSATNAQELMDELGRSNTVVESVSYGPARSQLLDELTNPDRNTVTTGQMNLMPLIVMSAEALRQNVPHTLAALSGGQYINFSTAKGFDNGIHELTNQLHNEYRLSFQPSLPLTPGIHHLSVSVPSLPDVIVRARLVYFSGTVFQSE